MKLILGGAGFIGSVLTEHLSKESDEIVIIDKFIHAKSHHLMRHWVNSDQIKIIDLDICDTPKLQKEIECIAPSEIYHLAANSDIRPSSVQGSRDFRDTLLTTLSLVESIKSFPVKK